MVLFIQQCQQQSPVSFTVCARMYKSTVQLSSTSCTHRSEVCSNYTTHAVTESTHATKHMVTHAGIEFIAGQEYAYCWYPVDHAALVPTLHVQPGMQLTSKAKNATMSQVGVFC